MARASFCEQRRRRRRLQVENLARAHWPDAAEDDQDLTPASTSCGTTTSSSTKPGADPFVGLDGYIIIDAGDLLGSPIFMLYSKTSSPPTIGSLVGARAIGLTRCTCSGIPAMDKQIEYMGMGWREFDSGKACRGWTPPTWHR